MFEAMTPFQVLISETGFLFLLMMFQTVPSLKRYIKANQSNIGELNADSGKPVYPHFKDHLSS